MDQQLQKYYCFISENVKGLKKGFKGFLLCFEEVTLNGFHLNQFQGFSRKTLLGIGPTRVVYPELK